MVAALAAPFYSCTNLDPEVFSDLTPANFPASESDIVSSYLSCYTTLSFMGNHNTYLSINEVASDEAVIPHRGSDWFDGGNWLRSQRHDFLPTDPAYNNAWVNLYKGILQTNSVIQVINNTSAVGDDVKTGFIAELRSLRAYYYWLLLDSFGDVPLITEESDPNVTEPAADSRATVFDYVVSELEASAPALSRENDVSTYAKINYWTNRALLSRVLLNAEVVTGTARWADAEAAADEVINGGKYSLKENYFDNFDPDNDVTGQGENMWVIPYDAPAVFGGFNLVMMTLHYVQQETFSLQEQPWNGYCTLANFYNSYDDTDLRKGKYGDQKTRGNFLAGPQYTSDGVTPAVDNTADDPGGIEVVHTPQLNALEPNCYREAGARIWKYGFAIGSPNSMVNDFPIIRYAEVLMNKAEAMKRQNKAGSSMLVNMIRERAGLDDVDDNMSMDEFLAERGREFFYEGTRRQDLIRFNKWGDAWEFKPASSDQYKIFPIPSPQLNANRNLTQNPGYPGA